MLMSFTLSPTSPLTLLPTMTLTRSPLGCRLQSQRTPPTPLAGSASGLFSLMCALSLHLFCLFHDHSFSRYIPLSLCSSLSSLRPQWVYWISNTRLPLSLSSSLSSLSPHMLVRERLSQELDAVDQVRQHAHPRRMGRATPPLLWRLYHLYVHCSSLSLSLSLVLRTLYHAMRFSFRVCLFLTRVAQTPASSTPPLRISCTGPLTMVSIINVKSLSLSLYQAEFYCHSLSLSLNSTCSLRSTA